MYKRYKQTLVAEVAVFALVTADRADASVQEAKLFAYNNPLELKQDGCSKWIYPWPGAKICVSPAFKTMRHDYIVVLEGPDLGDAIKNVVTDAFGVAVGVGVAAAAALPTPDPASRVAAGLAAAKSAFFAALAANALTRHLAGQYTIKVDHRFGWS